MVGHIVGYVVGHFVDSFSSCRRFLWTQNQEPVWHGSPDGHKTTSTPVQHCPTDQLCAAHKDNKMPDTAGSRV